MKKAALGIALTSLLAVNSALASWEVGLSYANLSEDADDIDISVDVLALSASYEYAIDQNWYIVPELKLGSGISEDTPINESATTQFSNGVEFFRLTTDVEVDSFIELAIRFEYKFDSGMYLFAVPSYANVEVTADAEFEFEFTFDDGFVDTFSDSASETDDEWEFGVGIGLGYQFTEYVSAEFAYQQFDETDVIGASVKYAF